MTSGRVGRETQSTSTPKQATRASEPCSPHTCIYSISAEAAINYSNCLRFTAFRSGITQQFIAISANIQSMNITTPKPQYNTSLVRLKGPPPSARLAVWFLSSITKLRSHLLTSFTSSFIRNTIDFPSENSSVLNITDKNWTTLNKNLLEKRKKFTK